MPTVLRIGPCRLFFYAGDREEPPHFQVERERNTAKVWLQPVRLQSNQGFSKVEMNKIVRLVEEHQEASMISWHEYFGR
jgi:hypothetical protein